MSIKELESKNETKCQNLSEDLNKLKLNLNKEIESKAKQFVSADLSIDELNKELSRVKAFAESYLNEIEHLKNRVSDLLNKQKQLEDEKLQLSQDWQQKYNSLERLKSKDSEKFNKQIMDSRDQVLFLKFLQLKQIVFIYFIIK